uniref:Uncharacterized protein n=1 Tax=Timema genevievae TaxID=629358 RepID=A0A7R9PPN0_TIMGE|nr:unnamed protein product [Timema genevievae]
MLKEPKGEREITLGKPDQDSNPSVLVTLEEQMICGALQTLNEEACEDVMEEAEETGLAPPGTELGESVSSSMVDLCDEFDSTL